MYPCPLITSGDTFESIQCQGRCERHRAGANSLYEFVPHLPSNLLSAPHTFNSRSETYTEYASYGSTALRWTPIVRHGSEGTHLPPIALSPGENSTLAITATHEPLDLLAVEALRSRAVRGPEVVLEVDPMLV